MLIYLYGDDTLRSREKLRLLTTKFLKDVDPSGINLAREDGSKLAADTLGQLLGATPFLARRRMVVIERLFENKNDDVFAVLERFADTQTTSSSDDTIVVLWESGTPKHAFVKKLSTLPLSEHFGAMAERDASLWVTRRTKDSGVTIDARAARDLAARFPNNPWALTTELHKLCAYAKRDLRITNYELRITDVNALAGNFAETPIYMFSSAIEAGSLRDAASHLRNFLASGTPPLVLVATIAKLLTHLIAAKRGTLPSLKLHPYVEKKVRALGNRITPEQLADLAQRFLRLEHKMKTTSAAAEVELLQFLGHATRLFALSHA